MKRSNAALLISTAATATALATPGAFAQQAPATRNSLTLEEVIVTAQKRQEALQDVPQSITVLSNATFERQQADNLQDYLALIPGLSLESRHSRRFAHHLARHQHRRRRLDRRRVRR